MPPKTRASAISATAFAKLENARVPGRASEVTLNAAFSPNAAARMNAAEPLTVEWPDGYSGCGGVPVQRGKRGVALCSKGCGLRLIHFKQDRVRCLNRRGVLRSLVRCVGLHMQRLKAWLNAVNGVENRRGHERDHASGYQRTRTARKDGGVHDPDPLQYRVRRGRRHQQGTSSEERHNQRQHC